MVFLNQYILLYSTLELDIADRLKLLLLSKGTIRGVYLTPFKVLLPRGVNSTTLNKSYFNSWNVTPKRELQ